MTTFCTSTRTTELVEALLLSSSGSSPASVSSDDDCSEVEMMLDFDEEDGECPLPSYRPTDLHLITAGDSEAMSSAVFCFIKNFVCASGSSTVAIDNKIEQAMDLVKSHLMFAVREEVEVLKERIAELMDRIAFLETENGILRSAATQETLAQIAQLEATFPTASAVEPTATSAVALPPTTATSQPGNNNNNGTSPAP